MKRVISLILLFSLLYSLCACTPAAGNEILTFDDNGILTDTHGNRYRSAPVGYEPQNQGALYGKIDDAIGASLYQVGTLESNQWLTGAYSGATTLFFYNEDITLPTLWEMEPELCYLCAQETNVITVATIDEGAVIDAVITRLQQAIASGESDSMWPRADVNETYQLKFCAEQWPAFYYNLVYASCGGGNYVYDRQSRICVEIGDLLLSYHTAGDLPDENGN